MAFIDYGFIAVKNNKIITDFDLIPVEPYKYTLEDKNENSYILPEDIEKFKKSLDGYRFVKFKEYRNNTIILNHITLQEIETNEFLNILYGYDVDTEYTRNYFVGKRCRAFLNRYTEDRWELKKQNKRFLNIKFYVLDKIKK